MKYEPPTKVISRAHVWRPGCKRLVPEKPSTSTGGNFAFVSQGIINRNPKKK
jgi:hypothetical protein